MFIGQQEQLIIFSEFLLNIIIFQKNDTNAAPDYVMPRNTNTEIVMNENDDYLIGNRRNELEDDKARK